MKHQRTGRGHETREITTLVRCSGCGERFQRPHFSLTWANCSCTPGVRGHRIACCMRGDCRTMTFDPPCLTPEIRNPLEGHDHWDDVQHGPTLDVGD